MSRFGWGMVVGLAFVLGCASQGADDDSDSTSEGALGASGLHSMAEAQGVVSEFFGAAEAVTSGDYEKYVSPELLRADHAYDATDPAPGPSLLRCGQDSPREYTVDSGVRIGNEAAFTVRYTYDPASKNFGFRQIVVRLTDLKITFAACGNFIAGAYKSGQGGGCVAGTNYCGGDKVSGDPQVLYRCVTGSSAVEVQYCKKGCEVRAGDDDRCKP